MQQAIKGRGSLYSLEGVCFLVLCDKVLQLRQRTFITLQGSWIGSAFNLRVSTRLKGRVSDGWWSYQRLSWGRSATCKLPQIAGGIHFLEVICRIDICIFLLSVLGTQLLEVSFLQFLAT